MPSRLTLGALALGLGALGLAASASGRMSTVFDELPMMASGVRGYSGEPFDLLREHPQLGPRLFGGAAWLVGTRPPAPTTGRPLPFFYAQWLFDAPGNDPHRAVLAARAVALALTAVLLVVVFAWARALGGALAGFLALGLCAFVPDVLAHGALAYTDVPNALGIAASLWATDAALRRPTAARGLLCGAVVGVALSLKSSAVALGPMAILLVAFEVVSRRRAGPSVAAWVRALLPAVGAALVSAYTVLFLAHGGDPTLDPYTTEVFRNLRHASSGHNGQAFLWGQRSRSGFWYFFPVAFFLKTPLAFHGVAVLSVATLARGRFRHLAGSPLRAPVVGLAVFGSLLLAAKLNIGFRYALPIFPLACVLMGVALCRLWPQIARAGRLAIATLVATHVVSSATQYPNFISYLSEPAALRTHRYDVLADSCFDWGQGLVALRDFMREQRVPRVYLSYFGSVSPAAYGIRYLPLPSFAPLPPSDPPAPGEPPPPFVVVSSTNLLGLYFDSDFFAPLRSKTPVAVLGGSLYVYRTSALLGPEAGPVPKTNAGHL